MRKKAGNDKHWVSRVLDNLDTPRPERGPKTFYLRTDITERLVSFAKRIEQQPSSVVEAVLSEFLNHAEKQSPHRK